MRNTKTNQQPPKRKKPIPASSSTSKPPPQPRRSKLAKENNISNDEEAEIRAAFDLFVQDQPSSSSHPEPTIATADVRRCLIALNTPPSSTAELHELLETIDPDETGTVTYHNFLAIAALKLHHVRDSLAGDEDARAQEVLHAFRLFTKGAERDITMSDLRRVAKELKEDVPENVLRDMIREANGGGLGDVGMEEFEDVMRRAGVLG